MVVTRDEVTPYFQPNAQQGLLVSNLLKLCRSIDVAFFFSSVLSHLSLHLFYRFKEIKAAHGVQLTSSPGSKTFSVC